MVVFLLTIFGLCIGSFLNVVILRMPEGKSIVFPFSYCPVCKNQLFWYHNIPLISWVFLRGKCFKCKANISCQYPLVEFSSGVLFFYFGLILSPIQAIVIASIFASLLALSIIDFRYKAVPDSLSLPTLILALLSRPTLNGFLDALIFAGAFTLLRFFISAWKKQEAMGEADVIIAAIIGAVLGGALGVVSIYLAAIFALFGFLLIGKRKISLPFIPFLSLGFFITYLFQATISLWVGAYFG